jgi:hypothetical protein
MPCQSTSLKTRSGNKLSIELKTLLVTEVTLNVPKVDHHAEGASSKTGFLFSQAQVVHLTNFP